MTGQPHLKPLHDESTLSNSKLALFERLGTDILKDSLPPGKEHRLKTRPDETMLDGHHRVRVLRLHSEDVDALPGEVLGQISG
jgi:hypothetical protein